MPKTPARSIKGTLPTATYTNKGLVQGKGSNKTQQYLAGLPATDPGHQAFYREALNDIASPLDGKPMTYGGLQTALAGPSRAALLDAYAARNKMPRVTADQMQQMEFDAANTRMLARGAANPGAYAFPDAADAARRAPSTAQAIAHGNYAAADNASNAAVQAQRFADIAGQQNVMAAPGMAVRVVRGVAPAAAPVRVIRGNVASR